MGLSMLRACASCFTNISQLMFYSVYKSILVYTDKSDTHRAIVMTTIIKTPGGCMINGDRGSLSRADNLRRRFHSCRAQTPGGSQRKAP